MIRSALAVACLLLLSAPAAAERGEELERLRDAIRASRDRVATYEREERGLLETMEALDRTAYLLTRDAAEARHRAREARSDLAEIEVEAQRLEGQLEQTRRAMGKRAVALYRTGEVGTVTLLFSSGGLREFLSRVSALRLLLTHDAELIARHRAETAALSATRDRVAESASRLSRAEERARERSQQLNAERQTKRRLVARLHADRTRARGALVELEKAAEAFEATLQALRDAPERLSDPLVGPAFASLQRRLDPPVDAPIIAEFGRVVDA